MRTRSEGWRPSSQGSRLTMNLFGVMEVSGSALEAERIRAEVVAANMANAETTRTAAGGPYQRQQSFAGQFLGGSGPSDQEIGGVRVAAVVSDQGSVLRRYDPGHPDADKEGYVSYPDVNPLTEMVDLMGATRAYGLNSSAVQAEKGMLSASLDILK
jgi:flagellar basal-body rod protein FlgC